MGLNREVSPFSLIQDQGASSFAKSPILSGLRTVVERLAGLSRLDEIYRNLKLERGDGPFLDRVLAGLGVSYRVERGSIDWFPRQGPVVVVANHPFGGIEGLILAHLLSSVRSDFKVMANYLLSRITESREHCVFVDPFGSPSAAKKNYPALREAFLWLEQGGMLAVFPAGTVSHLQVAKSEVSDPQWSLSVARLVRRSKASVVPVFFHGRNGWLFQIAGLLHPYLRTALLPRELCNKRGAEVRLSIGSPISSGRLGQFESDKDLIDYLRLRTYILGSGRPVGEHESQRSQFQKRKRLAPVVAAPKACDLKAELSSLPQHQRLVENSPYSVWYARSPQIPRILHEIGRLREISFRAVEEGTGRPIDLDHFDNFYTHLFVWNEQRSEVVGAYRLVKTDYVLSRFGKRGFYTFTLFSYKSSLLRQLGPALELGRSFVRPEYQRDYLPLLMLWRGIGSYVVRNPRYKILFGPVSINSEYDPISRHLIMTFLRLNRFLPELGRVVKARNPMPRTRLLGVGADSARVVRDLRDVSELLAEMEAKNKTVPVLLRQYLKLNAKLLGFNVDPSFGDALDGLIYVDLTETEPSVLERYLGKEGTRQFLEYHGKSSVPLQKASA